MNATELLTAYYTIVRKEVVRFTRIWMQTLLPPVITQSLYFLIFGAFIGSQVGDINGVSYMAFIVPGLVMMAVISNSYNNVVSSFFSTKFQKSIEEILVSPTPNWVVIAGYTSGGAIRGLTVGLLVFLVSFIFVMPEIYSIWIILLFIVFTAVLFALGGLINAIFGRTFDDLSIFLTFVLTPLIYLGGVFYSINNLPEFWQGVSRFNPILYMVNGFRYGFYGFSDVSVVVSVIVLIGFTILLAGFALLLMKKGIGLRK
ncbi:ABC transporter permease [Pseudomonadota bacterium]